MEIVVNSVGVALTAPPAATRFDELHEERLAVVASAVFAPSAVTCATVTFR